MNNNKNTLCKTERLNSKNIIEKLFAGGAKSFVIFPIRAVFIPIECHNTPATILVSVPKKKFKHAVQRNLIKRQIREAYRKNKHTLVAALQEKSQNLAIAFIYLDNHLPTTRQIEEKTVTLLARITEKLND